VSENYDVIVVGGGNAALCAALAAREAGARVLVLERSPENERGGNTRHTRNIRCTHSAADQFFSGPYSEEEHLQDLIGVTGGPANLDLAKLAVRESSQLPAWMSSHGVHWQQPLAGTLHLGRTNRWFLGGGKAMLNTYYRAAARMGIDVRYNARVEDVIIENNRFEAVRLKNGNGEEIVRGGAVVVAAEYHGAVRLCRRCTGGAHFRRCKMRGRSVPELRALRSLELFGYSTLECNLRDGSWSPRAHTRHSISSCR